LEDPLQYYAKDATTKEQQFSNRPLYERGELGCAILEEVRQGVEES